LKSAILVCLLSFVTCFSFGYLFIRLLKRKKVGQPILKYVEEHKEKSGTPTMGGLFFLIPSVIIFLVFGGYKSRLSVVAVSVGLSFLAVGFLDDFIKLKFSKNEGLRPYQKIIFQLCISLIVGFFAYYNGITFFNLPYSKKTVDLKGFSVPIIALSLIAITNSVNLTDGLDGLAGGVSLIYLIFLSILIILQINVFNFNYFMLEEYKKLILLCFALVGGILSFLCFNVNKASVFMGDTGSLGLGGFIGVVSIFTSNLLFIPILGIMFVASSISVIVQVIYYKLTEKRVFLKAPLHHHFQLKGYSEAKISFSYCTITLLIGVISVLVYV